MRFLAVGAFFAAAVAPALAINLYSNRSADPNVAALNARALAKSGAAAPAGGRWSEVQNDAGNASESNTVAGFGFTGTLSLADDFTVTGPGWIIDTVQLFSYRTGGVGIPHTQYFVEIYSGGAPNAGGSVIFGDMTTNRFSSASATVNYEGGGSGNLFRVFNTVAPPPGTAPGTTRQIWNHTVNIGGLVLGPGTYWIRFKGGPAGGFYPSTTHEGMRGVAGANALQENGGVWVNAVDAGNPGTAPDVAQDLPFILSGTIVPEPGTLIALGLGAAALAARRRRK